MTSLSPVLLEVPPTPEGQSQLLAVVEELLRCPALRAHTTRMLSLRPIDLPMVNTIATTRACTDAAGCQPLSQATRPFRLPRNLPEHVGSERSECSRDDADLARAGTDEISGASDSFVDERELTLLSR